MVVAETDSESQHTLHTQSDVLLKDVEMDSALPTCTSDEVFTCNQCMETFVDRDALFKHVKMEHQQHVHARRRFTCDQCQRTFKSMTGLRNHVRTHLVFYESYTDSSQSENPQHVHARRSSVSVRSSIEQANTTSPCTLNSTFTMETECTGVANNLNKAVTQESAKCDYDDDKHGSRDKCATLTESKKSERRRSGIPLPVRRPLLQENKSVTSEFFTEIGSSNEPNAKLEQSHETGMSIVTTPTKGYVTRTSRRLTRDINMKLTQKVNQKVQRVSLFKSRTPKSRIGTPEPKAKLITNNQHVHKSPFGTKYTTVVGSPVTPVGRSRSNKRIGHNGKTTPNNGKCTPINGRRTPASGKSTPVKDQRTPRSAKGNPACKMFNCKKCGKSFVDNAKLEVHFAVHIRDTPERCGIPKYALKKTPNMQKNDSPFIKAPPGEGNSGYSCKHCGRTYPLKKYLDAHMKVHDVITPFGCDYCDKKFRFMSSLKAHSFVHQGESRDFSNNITVDQGNTTAPTDNFEMKSGETSIKFNIFSVFETSENPLEDFLNDLPFTCKMCSFKTRAPGELLIHMKTHSKSGRFKCRHCCKSYTLQSNLKMHEKVHTINKLKQILIENTNNKKTK